MPGYGKSLHQLHTTIVSFGCNRKKLTFNSSIVAWLIRCVHCANGHLKDHTVAQAAKFNVPKLSVRLNLKTMGKVM